MNKVSPDPCWWCGVPADSREHKFKRSDLIREHGQAPYVGGATLSGVGASGSVSMRSSKNDTLRFAMTMCQRCNNERSQPFDNAYDQFIEWILPHEETVVDARSVDLDDVFGASWQQEARNLLCYFVKHMCCRLAEIKTPDVPATIPPDVIAFLDGGPNPASLMCEFSIEPALLHWRDMRPDDPLWTPRPLWLDELFLTGSAPELQFIQSRWRYSWLSLAWAVGLGANGSHPFAHQSVPIPIVAGSWSPLFELVLADGRYRDATGSMGAEDGIDPAVLTSRATRMRSLWDSPVVLAFVASALDFEAAMRGRAPDARRNTTVDADVQVSLARELRRTEVLINVCSQWARGRLDERSLRAAARRLPSSSIEELAALSTRIQGEKDASTAVASLRADFASLATLQLARAYELGPDTPAGQESLLEAARLAGCCVIACALAANDVGAGLLAITHANEELAAVD